MKNKILLGVSILCLLGILWLFNMAPFVEHPYINRWGSECNENFSRSYGAFESCGQLMSEETASIGLVFTFAIPMGMYALAQILSMSRKSPEAGG